MKIIIDNQSTNPDTVALAAVKEMMLLPHWPEVQMRQPKGYFFRHSRHKAEVQLFRSYNEGLLLVMHFVVVDFSDEEEQEVRQ